MKNKTEKYRYKNIVTTVRNINQIYTSDEQHLMLFAQINHPLIEDRLIRA